MNTQYPPNWRLRYWRYRHWRFWYLLTHPRTRRKLKQRRKTFQP